MSANKDVLDHLCATDPHWGHALQIVQLAAKQSKNDPVSSSAQIVSALVLLAADSPNPAAFLEQCALSLLSSPFSDKKPGP
jgi:hypothetical protein